MKTNNLCCSNIVTSLVLIIIISAFLPNYTTSINAYSNTSKLPKSFGSFKDGIIDKSMISSTLKSHSIVLKTYNTTDMISYVGEVNVSNLPRPLFKPFIGINSKESYLTRNFQAYKSAKNQSEIVRPNTSVLEIEPNSYTSSSSSKNNLMTLTNKQWPLSHRSNYFNTTAILSAKFEGLSQNCCVPPDIQVAAGTKHVVEMVNLDGAIYTKNGTLLKSFGLEFLFGPTMAKASQGSDGIMSDPVLLFDNLSGRWFASISDITIHSIRVAVSKTDDPTGVWRIYNIPFGLQSNNCSDQPFIGLSKDKLVITVNNWDNDCDWRSDNQPPKFMGVQFTVACKADLLSGSRSVKSIQSEPELTYFSLHPAITFTPTTTLLIVTAGDFNHNSVQALYIDGHSLYHLQLELVSYGIQDTHVAPDGIQPMVQVARQITKVGEQQPKVSTGDARIQNAIWYQGKLWIAFNDGCFIPGDTKSRSCIRLIQIDTTIGKVIQDIDVGSLASSLYYPAISISRNGTLGIIFGYSSHSVHPSLLVSTRSSSNYEFNSIKMPQYLKLGTANELSNRYGDYFAASSDPSNSSVIWVAGEYHSMATWSTYIGGLNTGTTILSKMGVEGK
ncbi:MAG: hypothetical protein JO297_03610 [Nitrososphaeraceae archaeon]|nr:hypothetical protein [Nitrososphaeraceae archaeon]